ncbi:MAG: hypothetical protein AABY22_10530, partial [Nanoarchaeota archaeon]
MFINYKNLPLTINGYQIPTFDISLTQKNNLKNPFLLGEQLSFDSVPEGPFQGNLAIQYYLTGNDFLKRYIDIKDSYPLSGNFGGLLIDNLYLTNYSVQGEPNNPITVNAELQFFNEISGTFHSSQPNPIPPTTRWLNCNTITLSENIFRELNITNLLNFSWNYNADITPAYHGIETGIKQLQPFRILFGEKTISTSLTSEVNNSTLPFTGQNYGISISCVHPDSPSISEIFVCSGKINTKTISSNTNQPSLQQINITQKNINSPPKMNGVSLVDAGGVTQSLLIDMGESVFSSDGNKSFIENVYLQNKQLNFTTPDIVTISATIPNDAVNGILKIETTKGNIIWLSTINLNYPDIIISGFYPSGGQQNTIVNISGANFYGITDVYFGDKKARFQVNRDSLTGTLHRIVTTVPEVSNIDYIYIISSTRNKSGISNQAFAPWLTFDSFSPVTGQWGNIITFTGRNFTGISGILFNGIPSHSFRVTGANSFTGAVPLSGSGYTKGYITLVSNYGQRSNSKNIYRPIVPVTGFFPASGKIGDYFQLYTVNDPAFMSPSGNSPTGYQVAFGNTITAL